MTDTLDRTERLGHADEFRCACGKALDQLGSECRDCEMDRRADRAYERASDR